MKLAALIAFACIALAVAPALASGPFVSIKGTRFQLNGKNWTPFGAMYTPLYAQPGEGKEPKDWIVDYDPKAIDEDLGLMQSLGMNAVRILDSEKFNNDHRHENWATYPTRSTSYKARFNDFLDRLGKAGMKAQLFLHYTPEGSRWIHSPLELAGDRKVREQSLALIRKTITELGLASRPELWSYEVDWEPHIGGEAGRSTPNALRLWNNWIIDQYGSVANARKSWGYVGKTLKVNGGRFIGPPTDDELLSDGEWTKKCVAYRRFIIELINRKHAYLADTIRSVDPNHLIMAQRVAFVSVIPFSDKIIAYPLRHTIAYLDYFGYTFSPHDTWGLWNDKPYRTDTDRFRKQGFAIRYAACGKPVIFDEYGASTWYKEHPELKEAPMETIQQLHYGRMLEVGHEFGISGALAWWWVGKRPMSKGDNEWSDWGIRRMDGTLKPAAETIKEWAPRLKSTPDYQADSDLVVDEFAHANENQTNIQGKADFLAMLKEGKHPNVVSQYHGTDSATCPLTRLDGSETGPGPIRSLDSCLGVVRVLDAEGKWIDVQYGDIIRVSSDTVQARLLPANTGDAKWLTRGPGRVALVAESGGSEIEQPIPRDVAPDQAVPMSIHLRAGQVKLRMRSVGRVDFGEVLRFTLRRS